MGMIANDFSKTEGNFIVSPDETQTRKQVSERHKLEVRRRIEELMEQKRLENLIHDDFDKTMDYLDA